MDRFRVGDRVCRREHVYDETSRLMTGTVTRRYAEQSKYHGFYPELYSVCWADGSVGRAYLPHGLESLAPQPLRFIKKEIA